MTKMVGRKSSAADALDLELIGFGTGGSPLRSLQAKVGEKPKQKTEPPDGFFDTPPDDDNGNGNGDEGNAQGQGPV